MKIEVISIGGSVIVPDEIDVSYLMKLRKVLLSIRDRRFVLVAGGGKTARKYITALKEVNATEYQQSITAMTAINLNAQLLAGFFGLTQKLPISFKEIDACVKKQHITCVGSFQYEKNSTSDTHAAYIAHYLRARFINITNVPGLYTKDPRKHRDAKLIRKISRSSFYGLARKMKFHLGQHFVLDQHAARFVYGKKILTVIVGSDLSNLKKMLTGKKFRGTTIA